MVKVKMNLDEQIGQFSLIPDGEYESYLYDVKPKTFRSGNKGYALTFTIAEGPYKGRRVFDNLVLVENAYWKLAQFWAAFTGESGNVEIDTDDIPKFIGNRVSLKIGTENNEYQGKITERNVVTGMSFTGGKVKVSPESALPNPPADVENSYPF